MSETEEAQKEILATLKSIEEWLQAIYEMLTEMRKDARGY